MEPPVSEFTMMISIAAIGILVLALTIGLILIYNQKRRLEARLKQQGLDQKKLIIATFETQEGERQKLASDLHDRIGAMLSAIRLNVLSPGRDEGAHKESLQQAKKMIDDTIDSVRKISRDLMPSTLQQFGLLQALKDMCNQYAEESGIKIEYLQHGDEVHFDRTKEIMLFRIVQELLNNAIKHAKCTSIQVLVNTHSPLRIEVADNGIGFNDEKVQSTKGIGLFNMQNRASLIGATLQYEPNRRVGTKATLTIPWA